MRVRLTSRLVWRLVAAAVLAGLVTGAVGAVLAGTSARRALRTEVEQRNVQIAAGHALRLDDRILTRANSLGLLATRAAVLQMTPEAGSELRIALRDFAELDMLALYDRDGTAVAAVSAQRLVDAGEVPARPGLVEDLAAGAGLAVDLSEAIPPAVEIAVPVEHPPGSVIGALGALFPLEEVGGHLEAIPHVPSALAYLVDTRGLVLVHPERDRVLEGERVPEAFFEPPRVGAEVRTVEVEGERILVAVADSQLIPAVIVVEQPLAAALGPAERSARGIVLILLLVLLATVIAVSVVGGYLLRRLQPLTEAAERLGAGEEDVRVPVRGGDEVALLAAGFNRMADALQRRMRELRETRRQEQKLREEAMAAETLHQVGTALTAQLDLEQVVQAVTDTTRRLTGADAGVFFQLSAGTVEIRTPSAVSGAGAPDPTLWPRVKELLGPVLRGTTVLRLDDVAEDPRFGDGPEPDGTFRSCLAVPVVSRTGTVLGTLCFGHSEVGHFTEAHERMAVGVAAQAAVAIDNARLFESEREAREGAETAQARLSLLADASRLLYATLEPDRILVDLASLLVPQVGDLCVVDLVEDEGSVRRVAASADPALKSLARRLEQRTPDLSDPDHPGAEAIRRMEPVLLDPVPPQLIERFVDDEALRQDIAAAGLTAALVVPLVGRRKTLGLIGIGTTRDRRLDDQDLGLVEELARRASIAIENARLYERERGVAEALQRSLLPDRLPEVSGVALAARYLPGSTGADVGGDWYDVIELAGGAIGVAMGDVVGRGIQAASLMGQLRNALRAYALEGHGPATVLSRLNGLMHDWDPEHMATLLYAVFDPGSRDLCVANAGHPPPVLHELGSEPTFVEDPSGIPLGASQGAEHTETPISLGPDATVIFYTDGLVEDRELPLDDGLDRLLRAVETSPEHVEALADHLLERCLDDRDVGDDVALLVLRALPAGDRFSIRLPARPHVLKPLRAALRRWLVDAGVGEQEIFDVLVAAGEAATNAIEHASGPGPTTFEVQACLEDGIVVVVRDRGRWRPARPGAGGRGLSIMESLMDEVQIRKGSDGTEVRMRRVLADGAEAPA